jgi:hypothetical protein
MLANQFSVLVHRCDMESAGVSSSDGVAELTARLLFDPAGRDGLALSLQRRPLSLDWVSVIQFLVSFNAVLAGETELVSVRVDGQVVT